MTFSDLARHLDTISRIATVTARYLTDLNKELNR